MIRLIIRIYSVALMLDAIFSFFPELNRYPWRQNLKRICDYSCRPIRKFLPITYLPFDFSPMIVIFLLYVFVEVFNFLW